MVEVTPWRSRRCWKGGTGNLLLLNRTKMWEKKSGKEKGRPRGPCVALPEFCRSDTRNQGRKREDQGEIRVAFKSDVAEKEKKTSVPSYVERHVCSLPFSKGKGKGEGKIGFQTSPGGEKKAETGCGCSCL